MCLVTRFSPAFVPLPYDPGNRHAASFVAAIAGERSAGMPGQSPFREKHPSVPSDGPPRRWQGRAGDHIWCPRLLQDAGGIMLSAASTIRTRGLRALGVQVIRPDDLVL